jgi:extradiol dioxygenase family protein
MRIEILEDKAQTVPIMMHHIHFALPDADIPKARDWYAKTFGGKPGMRGQNVATDLPGVNLSFSKSDTAMPSTKGHVLDHIGFDVKNLDAFCKKLRDEGVKVDRPYTKNPQSGTGICFIYDPWGTYIELNERTTPL